MTKKKRQGAGAEFALRHAEESNDVSHAMSLHELKSLYYLKKEIKEQQRRIAELETLAINCSTKITGLPTGKGISDQIGNYAAQIADLKALLDLNLKKCFYELNRISRYIEGVEEPLIKQIMIYRFECHMSWLQIERAIGGKNRAESLRKKLYRYLNKK